VNHFLQVVGQLASDEYYKRQQRSNYVGTHNSGHTICVDQLIVCFRSFSVVTSELEDLGQESVSPVFDIREHVVERVLELEAAGKHREQV
jgi:hypothetical protein